MIESTLLLVMATQQAPPIVDVGGQGSLMGTVSALDASVALFRGVPYAEPPMGALRFQPPQPHKPWGTAILDATAFRAICLQPDPSTKPQMSESCLYLNIASPVSVLGGKGPKLPVMVWIHGGAYKTGFSNDFSPDVAVTASSGTVLAVSFNYRLGIFGFLGSEQLSSRAFDSSSGNWGIADQRAALAWVRAHIADFGGDPDDVTIWGESAGGNSVINHLAQERSFPFYAKVIIESGAYHPGAISMEQAQATYAKALQLTACASLECLLAMTGPDLGSRTSQLNVQSSAYEGGWFPVVDGVALNATPTDLIAAGQYSKAAKVLIGSNRDEDSLFWMDPQTYVMAEADFDRRMTAWLDFTDEELPSLKAIYANQSSGYPYPSGHAESPFSEWWWAAMRVGTDHVPGAGACGVRWLAKLLVRGGSQAVYGYQFAYPTQAAPYSGWLVPHTAEIPYVWGNFAALLPGAEAILAHWAVAFWINFARFGDPNKGAAVPIAWPTYEADALVRFEATAAPVESSEPGSMVVVQTGLRKSACDYQEQRYEDGRQRRRRRPA